MVVIKSKLSGYYFRDFGVWTPDPSQAIKFSDEWDARGFIRRERIEDVSVMDENIVALSLAAAA